MATEAEQIEQLKDEIFSIREHGYCTLANGEDKFFSTVGSAREAIKARQRKLDKLEDPFSGVMSSSNC